MCGSFFRAGMLENPTASTVTTDPGDACSEESSQVWLPLGSGTTTAETLAAVVAAATFTAGMAVLTGGSE